MNEVLVALDLEATGMDPTQDQIIEIGAVRFQQDKIIDRFEQIVKPDRPISLSIQSLTGITNDELRDAPRFGDVVPDLKEFVGNAPIVGQSIGFDLDMLAGSGLRLGNRCYDTFEFATILLPQLKTYDLGTIASALNVAIPDRHRAVADAEISMMVFNSLVRIVDQFDDQTLERMAGLLRVAGSMLAPVFASLLRTRRMEADSMGGTSIGAQLLSRLGESQATGQEAMFLVPRERPARLDPVDDPPAIPFDAFDEDLRADGVFSEAIPGYEVREPQLEMMHAVAENIGYGGQLLVEAGTGTGKSLGYLLPAALHAVEHGEPVVVSTATIALQDQLINNDVPAVATAAAHAAKSNSASALSKLDGLRTTVLKGRANYLCLREWFFEQRTLPETPAEAELHAKIIAWLPETETGDRSELRLTPEQHGLFNRLSEVEGSCFPAQCVFHRRNQCFLFRARQQAEGAHIVVVNHSLLLSDQLRGGSVLPAHRHLIVDEAHHLEAETTSQASYRISQQHILDTVERIVARKEGIGLAGVIGITFQALSTVSSDEARAAAGAMQAEVAVSESESRQVRENIIKLFETLAEFITRFDKDATGYERRVRITSAMRSDPLWSQIEIEWDDVAKPLATLRDTVSNVFSVAKEFSEEEIPTISEILAELELLELEVTNTLERVFGIIGGSRRDLICWFSVHQHTGEMALNSAPLEVADILDEEVYRRVESITLTSATLSTEGNFRFVRDRLGLPDADSLQVDSPFDYRTAAMLAIADDVPEPNQPGHQNAIHEALVDVCRASDGRAMVLFTSHNALQNAYYAIRRPLEREGILALGQRIDGSPRQLLERIQAQPQTVLLGTNSFWEGVDIPGEALSLLVITRLPFSVPSDPIFSARSELFDNPFIEFAVPQSILRFKQGFGRLIRSTQDRGVCLVLDRRIISKRYGGAFLASLPETEQLIASTPAIAEAISEWLGPGNAYLEMTEVEEEGDDG